LAFVAHTQRQRWAEAIDRRFFREHYDARRLLREVASQARQAGNFERAAPGVVARIEAALHPEFAAIMLKPPGDGNFRSIASAPSGQAPPALNAESKLIAFLRVLGKPLEVMLGATGWLQQQLPDHEMDFLLQTHIDLLVPVVMVAEQNEALLVLGVKRSEEPYTGEDLDLLAAIASSLALLLEIPAVLPVRLSESFAECPQCGTCYDSGAGRCAQESAGLTPVHMPRTLAGRYHLERRRGRGGMGAVYEATDRALERRAAVKVIREDRLDSAGAAQRFQREARAAAAFAHPNVVTIYDYGVEAGMRAFLVMELLEGATLRDELQSHKRLDAARTVQIFRGLCNAVVAAHGRQLIHRDLKPENIFLARSGHGESETVKVLDFGIAKFLPGREEGTETRTIGETDAGILVGTPGYMSPEQLLGESPAVSWDLWALAVTAYETLTGTLPFPAASRDKWRQSVLAGIYTPLSEHLTDPPAAWEEFFARSLAADRARRPKSAAEFSQHLEQALTGRI
jgi:serine/threonine-protein kinase